MEVEEPARNLATSVKRRPSQRRRLLSLSLSLSVLKDGTQTSELCRARQLGLAEREDSLLFSLDSLWEGGRSSRKRAPPPPILHTTPPFFLSPRGPRIPNLTADQTAALHVSLHFYTFPSLPKKDLLVPAPLAALRGATSSPPPALSHISLP